MKQWIKRQWNRIYWRWLLRGMTPAQKIECLYDIQLEYARRNSPLRPYVRKPPQAIQFPEQENEQ